MRRHERAERIQVILDERVPDPAVPLDHRDPFTLLVAVVLSAQCTDVRVNQVTPALFAAAATPARLRELPVAEIQHHIRSCGLAPQKARALRALAAQLVDAHGGEVPCDLPALEALPGVGHKTASVVMAQAFGVPSFPVDTHIHRLAWRWGLSSGQSVARTEHDLVRAFPREHWNKLHLQFIWFGRSHCPAIGHDPERCPICSWAMSRARRRAEARRRARNR
ncbi:MAG: endonuclease III [Planctomycetes bacterium]|nr:endonuclease III [Planctomycetota bacterium]